MVFSQHLFGTAEKLLSCHGAAVQPPRSTSYLPGTDFPDWHEDQVFKKPGRDSLMRIKNLVSLVEMLSPLGAGGQVNGVER